MLLPIFVKCLSTVNVSCFFWLFVVVVLTIHLKTTKEHKKNTQNNPKQTHIYKQTHQQTDKQNKQQTKQIKTFSQMNITEHTIS